jgi:hypothetical protein
MPEVGEARSLSHPAAASGVAQLYSPLLPGTAVQPGTCGRVDRPGLTGAICGAGADRAGAGLPGGAEVAGIGDPAAGAPNTGGGAIRFAFPPPPPPPPPLGGGDTGGSGWFESMTGFLSITALSGGSVSR